MQDKGVQDGRKPRKKDSEEDVRLRSTPHSSTDEPTSQKMNIDKEIAQKDNISASTDGVIRPLSSADVDGSISPSAIPSGYGIHSPVRVNLKIGSEHTRDGEGREVEFMFTPGSDDYKV